jgi:hypothetical protein
MPRLHTHYDNLKVARDAPPEVIRAAYKTLSQRFHPDRNPGNAEAARIMTIINASYEVLSDPAKRHAHDQWIAEQECLAANATASARTRNYAPQSPAPQPTAALVRGLQVLSHIGSYWFWYLLGGLIFYAAVLDEPSPAPPGPKPYQSTPPVPKKPAWVRPDRAPNGQPWPSTAGYVRGYQCLHSDGLSTVTVDNSRNDSDVFVKLVSLDGPQAYPVRQFFIPAYGTFTVRNVSPGRYDIRYRDLSTGGLWRSEAFDLIETPTQGGIQYSIISMTLYKVQHGNMQTYRLTEAEF